MKAIIGVGAAGIAVAVFALRCTLGIHLRREWAFVGSSWQPDLYIRVCRDCGRQVYDHRAGAGDGRPTTNDPAPSGSGLGSES